MRDVGGLYLQLTDTRPKRTLVPADYQRLGRLMTEIGKRTADIGIPVAYHNHMNSIGERPEEVDWVLNATDPRYVKVLLDVAHYHQGGGDPVQAIKKYADRILLLHIKDVVSPLPGATGDPMRSFQWVELGAGKVNLKGVFTALQDSQVQRLGDRRARRGARQGEDAERVRSRREGLSEDDWLHHLGVSTALLRRHEPLQLLDPVLHDDEARRRSGLVCAALLDHQEPLAVGGDVVRATGFTSPGS